MSSAAAASERSRRLDVEERARPCAATGARRPRRWRGRRPRARPCRRRRRTSATRRRRCLRCSRGGARRRCAPPSSARSSRRPGSGCGGRPGPCRCGSRVSTVGCVSSTVSRSGESTSSTLPSPRSMRVPGVTTADSPRSSVRGLRTRHGHRRAVGRAHVGRDDRVPGDAGARGGSPTPLLPSDGTATRRTRRSLAMRGTLGLRPRYTVRSSETTTPSAILRRYGRRGSGSRGDRDAARGQRTSGRLEDAARRPAPGSASVPGDAHRAPARGGSTSAGGVARRRCACARVRPSPSILRPAAYGTPERAWQPVACARIRSPPD